MRPLRAALQGPAGDLSACRACTRAWSAVHSPDAAARNRSLLACAPHPCRSLGARLSRANWTSARLDLAHQSKSQNKSSGNLPSTTGSVPRAHLQLGPGFLLRMRPARLSTRLAQGSVGCRSTQRTRSGIVHALRAWQFWNAPNSEAALLRRLQGRRCGQTGGRLWEDAEIDHRAPLFRVWSEHRDLRWPKLLDFWGLPNLQVINRDVHAVKCAVEARDRRAAHSLETELR